MTMPLPPSLAWKLLLALVLVGAIVLSACAKAPPRPLPRGELRRLVLAALILYGVGVFASMTHHALLAGVVYVAGIAACALAAWLSRGSDPEDPPRGGDEPIDAAAPARARRRAPLRLAHVRARLPRVLVADTPRRGQPLEVRD